MKPIQDTECEKAVMGSLLQSELNAPLARDVLNAECFTDPVIREIYTAYATLDAKGLPKDFISIHAQLQKQGSVADLMDVMETSEHFVVGNAEEHIFRLKELQMRRALVLLSRKLEGMASTETADIDDILTDARSTLAGLESGTRSDDVQSLWQAYQSLTETIRANRESGKPTASSPTGFREFDDRGLLTPGSLVIVAAESSQGKTSLATAMAVTSAIHGHPVSFYSMEMTANEITARIASMYSGVASSAVMRKPLSDSDVAKVSVAMDGIRGIPLYFDDNSTTSADKILSSIRTMALRYGIKGAVVDYLQILNAGYSGSREQLMGDMARRLKNTAKELGIWILALSQLNRNADVQQPTLARLRDSGQIAEAADSVVLVYRPGAYIPKRHYPKEYQNVNPEGTAMLHVAKGRNIGTFSFIVGFDPSRTLFYPLEKIPLTSESKSSNANFDNDMPF